MEIGSDQAVAQQLTSHIAQQGQSAQPEAKPSLKEAFDKVKEAVRVPAQEQPSLREVVESSNKRSGEVVDLLKEVSEINAHINVMQSSLLLSVDSASGRNVVTVTDKASGDLIRKIPSEEVLAMSARIRQYMESMQQRMIQGKESDLKGMLYEGKG